MPNTTALLGVAQAGTKLAASAIAPSAAAIAGGATVGTLGTILGAAVPILGLAAIGAPLVGNLFSCGTVSQVGCTKRSDSTALMNIYLAATTAAYQVETGAITPAQGEATIQQLNQQAQGAFQNPQKSWISPSTFYAACGSFTNNGTPESGPPCSSNAAKVIPTGTSITGPQALQDFANFIQQQPGASSPVANSLAASVAPITSALAAPSVAGIPGWVLLVAGAAGIYLLAA